MNDLINISGHICTNCNEINAGDYIIGFVIFIIFLSVYKAVKYYKKHKMF
jgi:uncharacterized membrane protein YjfL (UPF0719 family)